MNMKKEKDRLRNIWSERGWNIFLQKVCRWIYQLWVFEYVFMLFRIERRPGAVVRSTENSSGLHADIFGKKQKKITQ